MLVTSKLKKLLTPELLRLTAAICDTKRIPKSKDKMFALANLLYTYDVDFEFLGGATNRLALLMDGYAVKFAVEGQGFRDNLIEYSLSPELQPYVTRSYETNGYILIAEFVEVIKDVSTFQSHKMEIIKILDILGQDHLLGDVGFLTKNMTNWGIRDGHPVILDYAYCHRFTENLFTCDRCGQPLIYDQTYDKLMCSDRSMCKSIYTYNERKRVQGKQIDQDMIEQRKLESIIMGPGETSREIQLLDDILVGGNKFVINDAYDERMYNDLVERRKIEAMFNSDQDRMGLLIELARDPNNVEARKAFFDVPDANIPEPVYTEDYEENVADDDDGNFLLNSDVEDEEDEEDGLNVPVLSLSELVERAKKTMGPRKRVLYIRSKLSRNLKLIQNDEQIQTIKFILEQSRKRKEEQCTDEELMELENNVPISTGMDPMQLPPVQPLDNYTALPLETIQRGRPVDTSGPEILVNGEPLYRGQEVVV